MFSDSAHDNDAASRQRFAAFVLIAEALLAVLTMLFHPEVTQVEPTEFVAEVVEHAASARWVHGLMMLFIVLNFFAISEYGSVLRRRGVSPNFGIVFYLFGAIAFLLAASLSGFITTALAERYVEMSAAAQETFLHISRTLGAANQAFAKSGTIAYGLTALAWGVVLIPRRGFGRTVGIIGAAVGVALTLGILLGMRLDVVRMTVVTVLLSAWYLSIAIDLLNTARTTDLAANR